jgi:O-antigen/teichoic acid export membrane protein
MGKLAIIVSGRIFGSLQNFIVTVLVIRFAPEADAAAYVYCFMVGNLVQFFGLASLEPLIMRRVHEAKDPARVDLSAFTYAGLVLIAGPYLVALVYFWLQPDRPAALEFFLYTTVWTLSSVLMGSSTYLRARLELTQEAIAYIGMSIVMLIIKAGMIIGGVPVKYLFLVFAAECLLLFLVWRLAKAARQAKFITPPAWSEIFSTAKAGLPYVTAVGLGNIYLRAAFLVFGPLLTDTELVMVGIIGQLVTAGGLISHGLVNGFYPIQQRLSDEDGRFRTLLAGLFGFCVLWGVICGLGLIVLGDWLVHLVFDSAQSISWLVFACIGGHLAFQSMVSARNNAITIMGAPREVVALNVASLVTTFLAALALSGLSNLEGFALALCATALAGLLAGLVTPAGRRYAAEMWEWMRPDRLLPSILAIRQEIRR